MNTNYSECLLTEVAWEVCNQVGGIYTVIRSKVPTMTEVWGDRYCLVGPYFPNKAIAEFEPVDNYDDVFGQAVLKMRDLGYEVHYGHWLVSGRPKVVLINHFSAFYRLGEIKYSLWENHGISTPDGDDLLNQVIAFGFLAKIFHQQLDHAKGDLPCVSHFHEWMTGTAIPEMRRENVKTSIVFTTHATMLGRYLAMNDPNFYDNLSNYDWNKEAINFNIEPAVKIERAAAHGANVFTTVSEVTARECESLLGRKPELLLPNGLNIERFTALHEFQNLHKEYKDLIHEFVIGHFFQSYTFDLDKTLYFFTSGRYEYKNKGFDITLEALARLNWRLKEENTDITVVMFFITKQPFHTINPQVLQSRAVMEEVRNNCDAIVQKLGDKLFEAAASSSDLKLPDLNKFVDEYWKLRLRRTLLSWKSHELPKVVTHNLIYDNQDEILNSIRNSNMVNNEYDKVKIVYHPDFITSTNPLFGMEYGQFVRGCHLGVFPSYYEPWGYTPLECMASGVPATTSDLAGFGDYVLKNIPNNENKGIYVTNRFHKSYHDAAQQLTNQMYHFVHLSRRDRITQRNRVESASEHFDWQNLGSYYDKAHRLAFSVATNY